MGKNSAFFGALTCVFAVVCMRNAVADDVILPPNSVILNSCIESNIGVYMGGFEMVPVYQDTVYTCAPGKYLPHNTETCETCPANAYCPGGDYTFDTELDRGIMSCADGLMAPAGMWQSAQCGHVLHVGDSIIYLRSERQTSPSVGFLLNDGVFYANATTSDVSMNSGTTRKLKFKNGDNIYSVYDDTVDINVNDDTGDEPDIGG